MQIKKHLKNDFFYQCQNSKISIFSGSSRLFLLHTLLMYDDHANKNSSNMTFFSINAKTSKFVSFYVVKELGYYNTHYKYIITMSGMQIKKVRKMTFFRSMPKQHNFYLFRLFKSCASYYTHYKCIMTMSGMQIKKKGPFFYQCQNINISFFSSCFKVVLVSTHIINFFMTKSGMQTKKDKKKDFFFYQWQNNEISFFSSCFRVVLVTGYIINV